MKRLKNSIALICSLFLTCAHFPPSPSKIEKLNESIVMLKGKITYHDVINDVDFSASYSCTAFSIKNSNETTYLITNKHCCPDSANVSVIDNQHNETSAEIIKTASNADLCLVETEALIPPLKIRKIDAAYGEQLMSISCARGICSQVTTGFAGKYDMVNIEDEVVIHNKEQLFTAPIAPGSSGSPLLDKDGQVIGVANLGMNGYQSINMMVTVTTLNEFLDKTNDVVER